MTPYCADKASNLSFPTKRSNMKRFGHGLSQKTKSEAFAFLPQKSNAASTEITLQKAENACVISK